MGTFIILLIASGDKEKSDTRLYIFKSGIAMRVYFTTVTRSRNKFWPFTENIKYRTLAFFRVGISPFWSKKPVLLFGVFNFRHSWKKWRNYNTCMHQKRSNFEKEIPFVDKTETKTAQEMLIKRKCHFRSCLICEIHRQ